MKIVVLEYYKERVGHIQQNCKYYTNGDRRIYNVYFMFTGILKFVVIYARCITLWIFIYFSCSIVAQNMKNMKEMTYFDFLSPTALLLTK